MIRLHARPRNVGEGETSRKFSLHSQRYPSSKSMHFAFLSQLKIMKIYEKNYFFI